MLRQLLNVCGFLAALVGVFLLGFWVIGPRLKHVAAPQPTAQSDLDKDIKWSKAPAPPAPKPKPKPAPAAEVEVSVIASGPSATTTPESGDVREAETLEQLAHSDDSNSQTSPEYPATTPKKPHRYYVQAGVFADRTNADTTVAQLANQGYGASVRQTTRNGQTIWQVLVGKPRTRPDAQQFLEEIRGTGREATLTAE